MSWIDLALDEQQTLNISIHNAKVREKQEILKDLIKAPCFLAKKQLAFCGNDESTHSANRGNYVELLHAFAGLSNRIQNYLIKAVEYFTRNDVKNEICAAPFVAVEVDETWHMIIVLHAITTLLNHLSA